MNLSADYFALFDLPRAFRIDAAALEVRYRKLQAEVHPDRHTQAGEAERRLALQWATRVNEAWQALRRPLSRASYLLSLLGHAVQAESNTAMSPDFLMAQMEWREAVAEAHAARDHHELEHLHHRLSADMSERIEEIAALIDAQHDYPKAADRVRQLMFFDKLLHDIDDALASLED